MQGCRPQFCEERLTTDRVLDSHDRKERKSRFDFLVTGYALFRIVPGSQFIPRRVINWRSEFGRSVSISGISATSSLPLGGHVQTRSRTAFTCFLVMNETYQRIAPCASVVKNCAFNPAETEPYGALGTISDV